MGVNGLLLTITKTPLRDTLESVPIQIDSQEGPLKLRSWPAHAASGICLPSPSIRTENRFLLLTGNQWSSNRSSDDRGHPSGYAWYFDFNEGRADSDDPWFDAGSALCVRHPGK
jgi:hypothetical protein